MTRPAGSFARRSDPQAVAVLAAAIGLELRTSADAAVLPLRGRKIGLMCETGSANAVLIRAAAEALGAYVAAIGPMWRVISNDDELRRTAEAVGRLYDAVDCEGMPQALLEQFERHCGVPVFEGLGSEAHPTAHLAELLDHRRPAVDRRRMIVQGALLVALR